MIKNWKQFNEALDNNDNNDNGNNSDNDIDIILKWVAENIESKDIPKLKKDLLILTNESKNINEGMFKNILNKLSKWFDEKILGYVVDRKAKFYTELIGKLELFDLTTLNDIEDNFNNFKLDSIYLAGGMDKAKDVGAGWRAMIEYEFEVNNKGERLYHDVVDIPVPGKEIQVRPSYIVDNENLTKFIKRGNKFIRNNYDRPAILNPVRKEVDRTKNKEFADEIGRFKSGDYEDTDDPRSFDVISNVFSKTIEPEDEIIVNKCDAVFVGFNDATSGGTFGELQQTSFLRKPIFAWYIDDWKISGHTPWNLPHVSKIMRTDEDMKLFVKTMINYNN